MAFELFAELAANGFKVAPGQLGENVITAGLDLTRFPLGTCLRIGVSAIVELTGLRTPCVLIERFQKGLKRAMIRQNEHPRFRCGVLGVVRATGPVMPGDPVTVDLSPGWPGRFPNYRTSKGASLFLANYRRKDPESCGPKRNWLRRSAFRFHHFKGRLRWDFSPRTSKLWKTC